MQARRWSTSSRLRIAIRMTVPKLERCDGGAAFLADSVHLPMLCTMRDGGGRVTKGASDSVDDNQAREDR
ncbi:hypothetical protein PHSY_001561 [Pseudozyma hubeiensis SY62]|uniref:Uncharacterized protein n=1 Tax=Pseudozyma hubeiensis (strain SY62) TaxID=1305764 RepID=R9NZ79_PSEHS|nr:hypothetical protein PHSY_001561 [Pseudozyma hubeiensis SY62]GAC93992.1 hypothetical protein PHSY_001561 [Pseudozyma hubeiensis SY62]